MSNTLRYTATRLDAELQKNPSSIERAMTEYFVSAGLGRPSTPEARSWTSSLPALTSAIVDAGLGNLEVLLEYRLPLTSRRADAVIAGNNPKTGKPHYVVVELKQWSAASISSESDNLVAVPGARYSPVLHPSMQVHNYATYMRDFLTIFESQATIDSIALLHNARKSDVADLFASPISAEAQLFTHDSAGDFREFLTKSFSADVPGSRAADALLTSRTAPSKQLLALAAKEIREQEQFVLLDEQRVAYELVLGTLEKARQADTKSIVLVTGGPGSGKSVIALSVLGELARRGYTALHATGSKSFTETLRKVAGNRAPSVKAMFKYFNSFMEAERNSVEVLILDEAHRMREKSVNRYTKKYLRDIARPQIDELIDTARVPVFLLDEHQIVRPGELGSVHDIKSTAANRGVPVFEVNLNAQYRAGGSSAYTDWVVRLLELEDGGPIGWEDEDTFQVQIVDSPIEMENILRRKLEGGVNARMTAGYCWKWSAVSEDGLENDVIIGDWEKPWNSRADRAIGPIPPSHLWAYEPGGFEQVGCVYTAQGFEYSWNGVILGPDLVWRSTANEGTGGWVSRREYNKDPDFKSTKTVSNEAFDSLVRNVYKVLLTRGLQGTLIYSTDSETLEFLRSLTN